MPAHITPYLAMVLVGFAAFIIALAYGILCTWWPQSDKGSRSDQ